MHDAGHAEEEMETRIGNRLSTVSNIYLYYARWITSHRDLLLRPRYHGADMALVKYNIHGGKKEKE